ncbi:hypothetical protein HOLleu_35845 [Holothuria leucospilota]|uniref:Uncharacterized protein n=1 Tax=Holothuria leucospilota TaxID=206669 RepID=A0A9Q1BE87_HOLLE|nr:hypothetical protein HOLleu_35845 [Holothuria leucospilota]
MASGRKMMRMSPLEPEMDKCFGFIHYLTKNYSHVCVEKEAKLIGIFSDPSDSFQNLKNLYMMKIEQISMQLEEGRFYGFKNYLPVKNGILIGPCTKPSVVLANEFEGFHILERREEAKKAFDDRKSEDNSEIPKSTVKTVKYELLSNRTVLSLKGVIKEVTEDPMLHHLKEFELYTSVPIAGVVTEVEQVEKYWACPSDRCYLKGVYELDNDQFQCPTCQKKYRTDKRKKAYFVKLFIKTEDGKKYDGVIFTQVIYNLRSLFRKPPSEKTFLQTMPSKLLGRKVSANYICKPDGPNNVFNTLEVD